MMMKTDLVRNVRATLSCFALMLLQNMCMIITVEQLVVLANLHCLQACLFQDHYDTIRAGRAAKIRRDGIISYTRPQTKRRVRELPQAMLQKSAGRRYLHSNKRCPTYLSFSAAVLGNFGATPSDASSLSAFRFSPDLTPWKSPLPDIVHNLHARPASSRAHKMMGD